MWPIAAPVAASGLLTSRVDTTFCALYTLEPEAVNWFPERDGQRLVIYVDPEGLYCNSTGALGLIDNTKKHKEAASELLVGQMMDTGLDHQCFNTL